VTALREIVLLRQLEHPNVVKLENVVMDPARLYLVFELVDTGERERERARNKVGEKGGNDR
jgi:Protein kinase domain